MDDPAGGPVSELDGVDETRTVPGNALRYPVAAAISTAPVDEATRADLGEHLLSTASTTAMTMTN